MSGAAPQSWFEAYLDAFNRDDFDKLGSYYAQDVQFEGQAAQLHGRLAVLEFYRAVKARVDERIEVLSFIGAASGDRIFAELRTTLTARDDWPDFPTGPLTAGECRQSINFVLYEIDAGRFSRIRSARLGPLRRCGRP
jgi:ketosteroid isomerase-like protein